MAGEGLEQKRIMDFLTGGFPTENRLQRGRADVGKMGEEN